LLCPRVSFELANYRFLKGKLNPLKRSLVSNAILTIANPCQIQDKMQLENGARIGDIAK
jgi:hypothetical protein